jgi:hypothetical protein
MPKVGEKVPKEFVRAHSPASDADIKKLIRNMTRHKPGSGLVIRHARQV